MPPISHQPKLVQAIVAGGYLPARIGADGVLRWTLRMPPGLRRAAIRAEAASPNPFMLGALFAFERANHLLVQAGRDGGWQHPPAAVTRLLANGRWRRAPHAWQWVLVRKGRSGETATLYRAVPTANGETAKAIFTTPANTGILDATPSGTWPVYLRFRTTRMKGSMLVPDRRAAADRRAHASGRSWHSLGVVLRDHRLYRRIHYDDPSIKWVSYFHGGDALHYYPRAHYGFPQSAGCVELPEAAANRLWHAIGYGTPVSVIRATPDQEIADADKAS